MGSDHAPNVEIDGALAATRDFGVGVILVGQAHRVEPELRRCGWRGDGDRGIELVDAAEVIAMDDPVAVSVRRKKKSSLRIGSKLVSDGRADGFVSAGNTGAAMATAKMVIGTLPGVDRPALAAMIPTKAAKPTLLLDVDEIVKEQVLLAVPTRMLCREDCKGICPECGTDRNTGECDCVTNDIDPRWAALKNLT
jgi:glycerol-3-phosphate acyltransferase PlsX